MAPVDALMQATTTSSCPQHGPLPAISGGAPMPSSALTKQRAGAGARTRTCMVQYIQNVKGFFLASSKRLSWPTFQTRATRKPPSRTAHAATMADTRYCGARGWWVCGSRSGEARGAGARATARDRCWLQRARALLPRPKAEQRAKQARRRVSARRRQRPRPAADADWPAASPPCARAEPLRPPWSPAPASGRSPSQACHKTCRSGGLRSGDRRIACF